MELDPSGKQEAKEEDRQIKNKIYNASVGKQDMLKQKTAQTTQL